ncbi:hypothetical protein HXX76_011783 [Chlamydomonas incerta]|uniref:Ankyrin repeat domain-containing protein n=1 Tax=Chlamydomonas incerta TaxID=51695 RepID=A0A835SN30_CHLIN|nr:hypothetical protein HXX76_011783 [Chlamydomonas incerta]|eukprot:KAG2426558.1 hypothetical protein HXX76_011783 [Chlamydomonas incerta]
MDSDVESFASALDDFDSASLDGIATTTAADGAKGDAADGAASSEEDGLPQEPYPLHRACWYGQTALVRRLAGGMSKEQLKELDGQGNTALHIAVMRRQPACVSALLDAGCPAGPRNARGWVPLMEAVELGDKPLALQLARAEVAQMRLAVKAKKAALLALLRAELPDFSLQLKWELGSGMPGVGALVRRYAPHDTYTLWKKGGRIRVDGSLMGVDDGSASLVPGWKRGHFSLLYDASGDKARSVFVNHTKKTWIDVKAARKKLGVDEGAALEAEVDMLMTSEVLQHKKLKSVDFRFKPVAGWLSKEVREKVEGWNTRLYEAAGRMVAISRYKMPYGLTARMSYDDYLAAAFEPDPVVESPVNPLNPASLKDRGMNPAKAAAKAAVAAKHQRIAAAAAQAEDKRSAAVATAAAARAAAGAMRALAPRIDADDDDEEEDGEGEGAAELDEAAAELAAAEAAEADGEGAGGGKQGAKSAKSGSSKKKLGSSSGSGGFGGMFKMPSGGGGGGGGAPRKSAGGAAPAAAADGGAVVHATADGAASPSPAASLSKRTVLSAAGADGAGGDTTVAPQGPDVDALLKEDLTAWAAQVAAEAAKANEGGAAADADGDADGGAATGDDQAAARRSGGGAGPGPGSAAAAAAAAAKPAASGKTAFSGGAGESNSIGSMSTSSSMFGSWGFGKKKDGGAAAAPGAQKGAGAGGGSAGSPAPPPGVSAAVVKKSRKMSGRCWMAESFPLSLNQLLPLLEVVGTANKAFAKVARFMRKYGDLDMFPVKVQIPLLLTVYMMLSFKQFTLLDSSGGADVAAAAAAAATAAAAAAAAAAAGGGGKDKDKAGKDKGAGGGGGRPHTAPAPADSFFEIPEGYTQGKIEDEDSPRGGRRGGGGAGQEEAEEKAEEEGQGAGERGGRGKGEAGGKDGEGAGADAGSDLETIESQRASQFKMKRKQQNKKKKDGGDDGPTLRLLKGSTEDDEMGLGGLGDDDD